MTLKFRSPTAEHIFLSIDSGHTADVGPEPVELPTVLHREAFAQGCVTDELPTDDRGKLTGEHVKQSRQIVKDSINALVDEADPDNFSSSGMIKFAPLRAHCGFGAERDVIESVWAEVVAERAALEQDDDGNAD